MPPRPVIHPKPKININEFINGDGSIKQVNVAELEIPPPLPKRPGPKSEPREEYDLDLGDREFPSYKPKNEFQNALAAARSRDASSSPPDGNSWSPTPRRSPSREHTAEAPPTPIRRPKSKSPEDDYFGYSNSNGSQSSLGTRVPRLRSGSQTSLRSTSNAADDPWSPSRRSDVASQSPNGNNMLVQTRHAEQEITLKLHDADHHPPSQVPTSFLSSKGRKILAANDRYICVTTGTKVLVYSWRSGKLMWDLKMHAMAAVIVAATNTIWLGINNETIVVVGINTSIAEHILAKGHVKPVTFLSLTPEGDVLSLSAEDGKVNLWNPHLRHDGRDNDVFPIRTHRITGRYSMVDYSGNDMWTARDVQLDAYDLRGGPIHQLSTRLTKRGVSLGTITSIAVKSGLAFFGQNDGFITVFDGPRLLGSINGGIHTITALAAPSGSELWAGTRSGEILIFQLHKVYDANANMELSASLVRQWKAYKGAVVHLLSAEAKSAVLSSDRLGDMKCWNLTPTSIVPPAPSNSQALNVQILSWNIDACTPESVDPEWFVSPVRDAPKQGDIIVIGLQEVIPLEDKAQAARKMMRTGDAELAGEYEKWTRFLENVLVPLGLTLVASKPMVGILTCVFVRLPLAAHVNNVETRTVKTGMGGTYGNKGSVIINFKIRSMSFCFINCHLAAGHAAIIQRNKDANQIVLSSPYLDFDACFFFGDTNYRINAVREQADNLIKEQNWERLRQQDQLTSQISKNPSFTLGKFQEARIQFAPTYKFDRGTNRYDTSDKKRIPSWCDRILFRGKSISVENYTSLDTRTSDHKAVFGAFSVPLLNGNSRT